MKKIILAAAVLCAFAGSASAQQAAASDHTLTGNLSVVTDYRFRGISQTFKRPAVQGGFDYAHSSGFYIGNWNSSLSSTQFPDSAGIEMDLYGGYKFAVTPDVTIDVGALKYYYPEAGNFNTLELYVGASYKWFSAKYSRSVSDDTFGFVDTKGSYYIDLNANFEIADKTTLGFHIGRQKIDGISSASYTDYKVGVTRDFGFATLGLALVNTNADDDVYTATKASGKSKELGDATAVLSLSKTF